MSESSLETDAPVCCEECVQEFPALGPKFLSSGLDHGGRECGICLGILPRFPKIARAVQEHLLKSGYRHRKFRLHLSLPPDVSLRHEAQTLSQTSSSSAPVHAFPPVGLKQRVRRKLADWLKKELMMSYDDKGELQLDLTIHYERPGSETEDLKAFFRSMDIGFVEGGRKQRRTGRRGLKTTILATSQLEDKHGFSSVLLKKLLAAAKVEDYRKFNVLPLKSIDSPSDLPESKEEPILKDHAAPQQPGATSSRIQEESEIRLPNSRLSAVIGSLADSILLAGNYCKYSREVSQTRWFFQSSRVVDNSVEEFIAPEAQKLFQAREFLFQASGREDKDVRMLGKGRPFSLELKDPKNPFVTEEEIRTLEAEINRKTELIRILGLRLSNPVELKALKDGISDKQKVYRCVVITDEPLDLQKLEELETIKDLEIDQKTPLRVLHRRAGMVRKKTIHFIRTQYVTPICFLLTLCTSAGTYVKEFVHGDRGRTSPSIGEMLGCRADIIQLDVLGMGTELPDEDDIAETSNEGVGPEEEEEEEMEMKMKATEIEQ